MSVHLGRFLTENEEVDHKDGNKTNDELGNLQVLQVSVHRDKTNKERYREYIFLTCAYCFSSIIREARNESKRKGGKLDFCNRSCSGKYYKYGSKGDTNV